MIRNAQAIRESVGARARTFPRAFNPKRASLMLGTALGCSIAILAASPNQAWAADECGADVLGVAVCTATSGTANPYPTGIDYTGDAGEDITVILIGGGPATAVDIVTGAGQDGVNVIASAGFDAQVNTYVGSSIDATLDGIDVNAGAGNGVVINNATIEAGDTGIDVYSVAGGAAVFNSASGDIVVDGSAAGSGGGIIANGGISGIIINYGDITVTGAGGDATAFGLYSYGFIDDAYVFTYDSAVTVDALGGIGFGVVVNGADNAAIVSTSTIDVYGFTTGVGLQAVAGDDAFVQQTGNVDVVGFNENGYGIVVAAGDIANVSMTGDLYVFGYVSGYGITTTGASSQVTVDGDVDVIGFNDNGVGIDVFAGTGNGLVGVTGNIDVYGYDFATGIEVDSGAIGLVIVGDGLTVEAVNNDAIGIEVDAETGAGIFVTGVTNIDGYNAATGLDAYTVDGNAVSSQTGNIYVTALNDDATGLSAVSDNGNAYGVLDGNAYIYGYDDAYGILADGGTLADVEVTGSIYVDTGDGDGYGIMAESDGAVDVDVIGNIDVDAYSDATGITATADDDSATVDVTGNVTVNSDDANSTGLYAYSDDGDAIITVTGDVTADAYDTAIGSYANSDNGNATVSVSGTTDVYSFQDTATGAIAYSDDGDASISLGDTNVNGVVGVGAIATSDNGAASVTITGDLDVYGVLDAYGAFAISYDDATVTITGNADVFAFIGTGFGVVANSTDGSAFVTQTGGDLYVYGDDIAAGIQAIGNDNADVDVTGVEVVGFAGDAYGIVAVGGTGTVEVDASGEVEVDGYNNAVGVQAVGATGASVALGSLDVYAYLDNGVGVQAVGGTGAADVTITGTTYVYGYDGAIGVQAVGAAGATVNLGALYVYGENTVAVGVQAVANGAGADASITITGDMQIEGATTAVGGQVVSSSGDATATFTGDGYVYGFSSTGLGFQAVAAGGIATVNVTGSLYVYGDSDATGILASGQAVNVDVDGDLEVYSFIDNGLGIGATSTAGDVNIDVYNGLIDVYGFDDAIGIAASSSDDIDIDGDSDITVEGFLGNATGISANAADFVSIDLAGDISADAGIDAYGIFSSSGGNTSITVTGDVVATAGDFAEGVRSDATGGSTVIVTGDITADAGTNDSVGVDVRTGTGNANVTVTGDIDSQSAGDSAWGVYTFSAGANANVVVNGDIVSDGSTTSFGVQATALGAVDVDTDGDITVDTVTGNTYGILADGTNGDVSVSNTGTIDVESSGATISHGVYAYSEFGYTDVDVVNINVTVDALLGQGAGVYAYGEDGVNVSATGLISTVGVGIEGVDAYSFAGEVTVGVNDVTTTGDNSIGANAVSITGNVYVNGNGDVSTSGDFADGLHGYSSSGDVSVDNFGTVTTAGFASNGLDGFANGGDASVRSFGDVTTTGDSSNAVNAGSITGDAYAYNSAEVNTAGLNSYGVSSFSLGGDATTVNIGEVFTTGDGSHGLNAYTFSGVATVDNLDGHVETTGVGADGIYAYGFAGVNISNGDNTVITSGDSAIGIYGFSLDSYVLINSGTVNTTGDLAYGIKGVSLGLDATDYVTINSTLVTTTGNDADGIFAYTYYGDITIDSGTVNTSGDSSYGINAYAYNFGDVDITSDVVTTNGVGSIGIYGYAFLGTTAVDSGSVRTFQDNSIGIYAYGFTGADVTSNYVRTYGAFSAGIASIANLGIATVDSFNVITSGDDSAGIVAIGHYGVTIDSEFVSTSGDRSDGVVGANYGGALVDIASHSSYTQGDYSDGIVAISAGYYDSFVGAAFAGSVLVDSDFVNTGGYNAYGIVASAGGGDVGVYSISVRTYGDFSTGIYAAAFNYYDSTTGAEQNLEGDVYVDSGFVRTDGLGSTGIDTYAEGGSIEVQAGTVLTYGDFSDGIDAYAAYYGPDPVLFTYYSGDVLIDADDVRTYGDFSDGINAFAGGGNVDVYATGVFVTGAGSDAIYAGTGGLDVNNTDNVFVGTYGYIYAADGVGVSVNSAGSSEVYVDEDSSVYGYSWGIQSASVDGTDIYNDGVIFGGEGRAIDVNGGATYLDNDGYIFGFVNLTDNADHFENDRTWVTYGTSSFGAGVDDVDNDGYVSFSRYTGAAEITTFTGLEFFDNAGTVTGVDDQVNDELVMTGTAFTGTGGSELDLDVQLGGPGSAADRLRIGSAAGSTLIVPNDLLAGSPGALNFGGILVVDSANAAEVGNEFSMDNVDKGFVEYELFFDAANDNWLIVGLPDDEVFELLGAMSSGQDFWKRSGDALSARWQETRDAMGADGMNAGPGGAGRSQGWELWMQAHGGDESFDNAETFVIGGFTFAQDITADSDWRGFQFGFDNAQGDMLWGLTMGFTQQETKFDFDQNSFDTEGWNIGGYFGWSSGGFFLNALVKGDFYEQDADFHTLPSIFSFDGVTWGAQGELGYRWQGDGFFFEPIASLAWTTTSLDSVTTSGATIDFDDSESLRGKAGARIGGTWGSGDVVVTPYIGAYWMDEFEGDNALTFTTGITSITFNEQGRDSYGMVDFGMTFQTFYGLEGFVKGEWNFGGDADGGAARLGARWRW